MCLLRQIESTITYFESLRLKNKISTMFDYLILFKFKTKLVLTFIVSEDGLITGGDYFHKEIIYYWLQFNIFFSFSVINLWLFSTLGHPRAIVEFCYQEEWKKGSSWSLCYIVQWWEGLRTTLEPNISLCHFWSFVIFESFDFCIYFCS